MHRRAAVIAEQLTAEFDGLDDGVKLPSEHRLAARLSVPRSQVRSALDLLAERHVIRRIQGAGTYINRPVDIVLSGDAPPSFHKAVVRNGRTPKTMLVDHAKVEASDWVAGELGCAPRDKLTRLTRIGWIDGRIASVKHEWLYPEVLQEPAVALSAVESLNEALRMGRHRPRRAHSRVSAGYPSEEVQEMLSLAKPASTWTVDTLTSEEEDDERIMLSRTWFRQDMVRIVVEW